MEAHALTSRNIKPAQEFIQENDVHNRSMDDVDLDETEGSDVLYTGRQSTVSRTDTFRDTEVSQADALNTMRIASLSSIVNQPKKDTLMKKLGRAIKDQVQGRKNAKGRTKFVYKPMTEEEVPESSHIPKVVWPQDFRRAFEKRKDQQAEWELHLQ